MGVSRRGGRVFYGWWIVAVASLQGMFGNGSISNGFPIFFEPIRRDLGIGYASMSLVFSLARAEGGMGGPLIGWTADKFGTRPLVLFGGLTAGIGMILLSRADSYWQLVLIFVGVVSVGKTAGLGQILMATVNQWFVRRKALAMSTLMTSFAGGGAIVVPLLGLGISSLGWRDTLLLTGIFIFLLTIPVSLVLRSKPEDIGLLPDGDPAALEGGGPTRPERRSGTVEFTVRQAIRTPTFWFMLFGVVARVSATNAIIIHIFPMLEDEGLTARAASIYVSGMFFLAIPLRFIMGVAGDRIPARLLLFTGMNTGALGLLALLIMDGTWTVVVFILALAIVEGVSSVNWIMLGDYFGRGRFASLMGLISVFHNVGLFISPIFSGWVKDQRGDYDLVMLTFIPLYVFSAVLFGLARKPTPPEPMAGGP
ncbi:MAG: hypothetical protein BZY80_04915 [SAR202 cluster bacterium Io17-Chloro-G2]|nr:MAG: hypothetical protein BZY80_04915 [SAR202 cluster bacterium Io17-Chloro-G2]